LLEWYFVVILGILGGGVSTLFLGGTDVPLPELWAGIENTWFYRPYRFLQNMILGGLASFLVWATHSSASFHDTGIDPIQAAASLIVGGGGGVIVNAFFQRAQDREAISRLTNALEEMVGQ
jgi:hypothetical protein